ncbi:HD domain-containing protein [Patescibacteria group bacterium]|nr:HD domain-containing protein [Patescibacteria group bacterium]
MFIPKEVKFVIDALKKAGFKAYIVGGCVRDLLRKEEPKDWDIATNAKPDEIGKVFPKSFINNKFGTVTVLTESQNPKLKEIEITPFRIDEKYSDKRHPDRIKWAKTIEKDLARRDFTINAIAIDIKPKTTPKLQAASYKLQAIDPFEGQKDLENKIIRTVGKADDRFNEDALRMMRAVRFAASLGFEIEKDTAKAIKKNSFWLQAISKERIRDELIKIIMADRASEGIEILRKLNLLKYILPELEEGYKVSQNKHHIYDCYEHNILSLKYSAKKRFNKHVRVASLFHDIAKPRVKQGNGPDATFYGHEILGAKMTAQILNRLKFPRKDIEKIAKLVRYHLFYYNVDEVSESSIRRLVRQVGRENMDELLQVRMADRIGSGVPKAEPYKLRHLRYVIEKISQDPISVKMLKVNGDKVMKILEISPGPKIGQILDILLGEVIEKPERNKKEYLKEKIKDLSNLTDSKLEDLAKKAREERKKLEIKEDEMTKKKYWVT